MSLEPESPQTAALDLAHKTLLPYFDSYVIVGRFSREDQGRTLDSVRHRSHGSFTDVRGLVEVYRDTLKNDHENTVLP